MVSRRWLSPASQLLASIRGAAHVNVGIFIALIMAGAALELTLNGITNTFNSM